MRQVGLRARDLDPVGRAYLDGYCRAMAKVVLMDAWVEEHGWLDAQGNPPPFVAVYFTALNSSRLMLARLEEHLKATGAEPSMVAILQGTARRVS